MATTPCVDYAQILKSVRIVRIPDAMIRAKAVHLVPHDLPLAEAALTEPLACVANCHAHMGDSQNESVVVLGAGRTGLMQAMVAKAGVPSTVLILDVTQERLELLPADLGPIAVNSSDVDAVSVLRGATDGLDPIASA